MQSYCTDLSGADSIVGVRPEEQCKVIQQHYKDKWAGRSIKKVKTETREKVINNFDKISKNIASQRTLREQELRNTFKTCV